MYTLSNRTGPVQIAKRNVQIWMLGDRGVELLLQDGSRVECEHAGAIAAVCHIAVRGAIGVEETLAVVQYMDAVEVVDANVARKRS